MIFYNSIRCSCDASDSDATEMSLSQMLWRISHFDQGGLIISARTVNVWEKSFYQTMWGKRERVPSTLCQATDLPSADVPHSFLCSRLLTYTVLIPPCDWLSERLLQLVTGRSTSRFDQHQAGCFKSVAARGVYWLASLVPFCLFIRDFCASISFSIPTDGDIWHWI